MVKAEKEEGRTVRVSPDLEIVYVHGGVGIGVDVDGITIFPFVSMPKAGEVRTKKGFPTEFVIKYMILLPPHVAKRLVDMLSNAVEEYEKRYGKIPSPPEGE